MGVGVIALHSHQHVIGVAAAAFIKCTRASNSMRKTKEKLTATKSAE